MLQPPRYPIFIPPSESGFCLFMRACEIALFVVPLSLSFHIAMWRIMRQLQWSKEAEAKLGRVRVRRRSRVGLFVRLSVWEEENSPGESTKTRTDDGRATAAEESR